MLVLQASRNEKPYPMQDNRSPQGDERSAWPGRLAPPRRRGGSATTVVPRSATRSCQARRSRGPMYSPRAQRPRRTEWPEPSALPIIMKEQREAVSVRLRKPGLEHLLVTSSKAGEVLESWQDVAQASLTGGLGLWLLFRQVPQPRSEVLSVPVDERLVLSRTCLERERVQPQEPFSVLPRAKGDAGATAGACSDPAQAPHRLPPTG